MTCVCQRQTWPQMLSAVTSSTECQCAPNPMSVAVGFSFLSFFFLFVYFSCFWGRKGGGGESRKHKFHFQGKFLGQFLAQSSPSTCLRWKMTVLMFLWRLSNWLFLVFGHNCLLHFLFENVSYKFECCWHTKTCQTGSRQNRNTGGCRSDGNTRSNKPYDAYLTSRVCTWYSGGSRGG